MKNEIPFGEGVNICLDMKVRSLSFDSRKMQLLDYLFLLETLYLFLFYQNQNSLM